MNPAACTLDKIVAIQARGNGEGTSMTSAITAAGLRKSFGGKAVLDGIDLEVGAGTTFSLLGPNGAGKTTTVQIMSTLVHADGGEVRVAGHDVARDPAAVRAAIGVTGQFSAVDNLLTGEENLLLMADLHHLRRAEGRRRAAGLLDKFDLADAARKTAATYSGGMRRRLDLAMTLIGDPRIIFLDEPTTGLDPRSRRMMWQTIRELVADGVTIFLTTQQLDEADELADRIAVLDHGKVVAEGSPEELKRSIPGSHVQLHFADATVLVSQPLPGAAASRAGWRSRPSWPLAPCPPGHCGRPGPVPPGSRLCCRRRPPGRRTAAARPSRRRGPAWHRSCPWSAAARRRYRRTSRTSRSRPRSPRPAPAPPGTAPSALPSGCGTCSPGPAARSVPAPSSAAGHSAPRAARRSRRSAAARPPCGSAPPGPAPHCPARALPWPRRPGAPRCAEAAAPAARYACGTRRC